VLAYDLIERDGAPATAVLLHPHPDYGGNRYHPAIDALFHGLPVSTLRFDFSSSDPAVADADTREAIARVPSPSVVLVGYSFGAQVALGVADPAVLGWFLVAPPLRWVDDAALPAASDPRPKHLLVPEHDQYSPPGPTAERIARWRATTMTTLPGSDHFLMGRSGDVLAAVVDWLPSVSGHEA
jgi:uncharacterized protein